jgi:hypothetical protein
MELKKINEGEKMDRKEKVSYMFLFHSVAMTQTINKQ